MYLFELRKKLSAKQALPLQIGGLAFILGIWILLTIGSKPIVHRGILPSPFPMNQVQSIDHINASGDTTNITPSRSQHSVLTAFGDLYSDNQLVKKTFRSIGLNLSGYLEALLLAIPLGFLIGLIPLFRGGFERYTNALRFIPLTAVTGLFIMWFGIGTGMKVHFLAFGIMIYLLPVVIQRIDEVKDVYLKTVYTLGATDWQTIRTVYIPSVMSRVIDDIRVLTAISWTYIIVAEGIASEEGLGSLIYKVGQRQGRVDKVFAIILLIVLIGVIQDKLFVSIDKALFPYKYQKTKKYPTQITEKSQLVRTMISFAKSSLVWILIGLYLILTLNEYLGILGNVKLMDYLFADTVWSVHIVIWLFILYKLDIWNKKRQSNMIKSKSKIAST